MLTAYNAGPGRLRKYLRKLKRRKAPLPDVAEFVETLPNGAPMGLRPL